MSVNPLLFKISKMFETFKRGKQTSSDDDDDDDDGDDVRDSYCQ